MEESKSTDCQGEVSKEGTRCGWMSCIWEPYAWLDMLSQELHASFLFGVVVFYGFSQGLGGAFSHITTNYYWKDVRLVQPSAAQVYQGIIFIPWIMKPA